MAHLALGVPTFSAPSRPWRKERINKSTEIPNQELFHGWCMLVFNSWYWNYEANLDEPPSLMMNLLDTAIACRPQGPPASCHDSRTLTTAGLLIDSQVLLQPLGTPILQGDDWYQFYVIGSHFGIKNPQIVVISTTSSCRKSQDYTKHTGMYITTPRLINMPKGLWSCTTWAAGLSFHLSRSQRIQIYISICVH